MNGLKWSPGVIAAVLLVFLIGLSFGGGIRLITLALNDDLIILSAVWTGVFAAAFFLWRAVRRYRSFDPEGASKRLVEQIEKDRAAAAEKEAAAARAEQSRKESREEAASGKKDPPPPPPADEPTSSEPPS